ncbi:MAG TPA: hypothetical protein VGN16_21125 [Acidobacteriaceae bacterium]|jgi:hypothetical protein
MAKPRPKQGEAREVQQPLKIDRLPPIVHRAIIELRNKHFLSWQEIEDLSAEPFGQKWDDQVNEDEEGNVTGTTTPAFKVHAGRGFVPWDNLTRSTLELFPDLKLPHTNLARWYDLRFTQVRKEMQTRSAQAREIAEAFAKSAVNNEVEAVSNAIRDQLMVVMSEDGSVAGRMRAAKALLGLAEVMQSARANDIKERKVAVDERKIVQLEKDAEQRRNKMDAEAEKLSKKAKKGEVTVADIDRLRERVFGLPPKPKAAE